MSAPSNDKWCKNSDSNGEINKPSGVKINRKMDAENDLNRQNAEHNKKKQNKRC